MVKDLNGTMQYNRGQSSGSLIKEGTSLEQLIILISSSINYDVHGSKLKYTLKFDNTTFLDLTDDGGVENLIKFNGDFGRVYIIGNDHQNIEAAIDSHEWMGLFNGDSHIGFPSMLEIDHLPCAISTIPSSLPQLDSSKWQDVIVGSGQIFPNADAFRKALYKYSLAYKFDYEFTRNNPDKMIVNCKVEGCNWKLTAYAFDEESSYLQVKTFHKEHIHSAQDSLVLTHNARCTLTTSIVIDIVRDSPDKTANDIRKELLRDYGLELTYRQALRAKEKALEQIHGMPEKSYFLIPWLCNRVKETDSETIAKWVADDNIFERLFIAYSFSIKGFFQGARPIIFVDGCHLSGPYQGTMLSASAYDADNNLFPLAYAIVGRETFDDWAWFLQNLKEITGSLQITIVSDRHHAIIGAVQAIFGGDRHAFCYRHVNSTEFTKVCKGRGRKSKEEAFKLLDAIAYARLQRDFDMAMGNLWKFCPELARWVETDGDVDRWSMFKFPYNRWDHITTYLAESFNSWLVKERRHFVCVLINEHRDKLARKFVKNREGMQKWKNGVGPKVDEKIKESVLRGEIMVAEYYGENMILVRTGSVDLRVNLALRECACKGWEMSGIPCPHACAAIKKVHGNVYNFVHESFLLSSQEKIYSGTLNPVETHDIPKLNALRATDLMNQTFLRPPMTNRPPGRPRKKRVESQFQQKKPYHCSRCQQAGHTKKTCTNPNPS